MVRTGPSAVQQTGRIMPVSRSDATWTLPSQLQASENSCTYEFRLDFLTIGYPGLARVPCPPGLADTGGRGRGQGGGATP